MDAEVQHNADEHRYEAVVDGQVVGIADYDDRGDALVFSHTVIDPLKRGKGLGAVLVKGALDDVRRSGRTVVPGVGTSPSSSRRTPTTPTSWRADRRHRRPQCVVAHGPPVST